MSIAPRVLTWEALLAHWDDQAVLLTGEIDPSQRASLSAQPQVHILAAAWQLRRAGFLAELGWQALRNGEAVDDPSLLNPLYLKSS
ncbi:MAG: hypothetical protein HC915_10070 [Anaerolineae bacterium]|nr:hypothetical protein [Anaerolineae bacterium]